MFNHKNNKKQSLRNKLLGGNIKEQILDLGIFDPKTLGHILHRRLQLAVAAAELFLLDTRTPFEVMRGRIDGFVISK